MANWTASYGRYITLKVTATELNVNTANNTSQVRVQTSLYYGGGTTAVNGYPQTLTVSVNGTKIGTQTGITYNLASGATKTLNTYTSGNITHNSDGSKSVNVTVSITDNAGDNGKISQTLTLTKIARASTPTLSASSVAIGSAVTINTNRASSSFTHTATFKFGSLTKTITTKNANASFSYTPTTDLATQIPNSSSGYGWITLTTYSGTTAIGTKSVKLTITVPSNSTFNPTISAPTVSEGVADVRNKVGAVYVQGKSKFVVKATPTTRGGATVKSVVFTVKGSTHTGSGSGSGKQYSATTGTLSATGSHAISVKVTDSRGRTATASIGTAPNVLAYSPPKITAFSASRRAGATTTVDIARTVTYSIVGSNTVNVKIDRQQVGSSTVTNVQNVNLTTGSSNNTAPSASTGNADANSYRFTLTVSDKFSSATSSVTISTAGATMSWGKNGISVGGIYNNAVGGALQISGSVYSNSRKIITEDGNIEVHDTRFAGTPTDIGLKGVMFEFKANNTDGLNNGEMYHGVMTFQQWNDESGGHTHQLGFTANGNLWMRTARIGGSAWGAWKMFANLTDVMDFRNLVRFHSGVDFYGNAYLNNNMAVMGKDTSGNNQRMIHKGTDNHLHINADAHGSTFLHTSTLPRTQVYLGTRDYRWLQFNVKGNAKNASASSPGSGASVAMWGSNSIFEMGVGPNSNEREGWMQVRHAENKYATAYGQLKLQPLGGSVYVGGTFSVAGSKNAIHATRDGFRLTPAYETAESYLGDIGESKTDYTNETKVYIETLFHDTVNTEVPYQVFLQSYGDGYVWVSERNYDHFIVKSSAPNIAFGWELKAKRRGYEEDRLVLSETTYEDAQTTEGLHGGYNTQSKEEEVITKEEGDKI